MSHTRLQCRLIIKGTRGQEEFTHRSMDKNPYSSRSMGGPLMQDLRRKIGQDVGIGQRTRSAQEWARLADRLQFPTRHWS